MKHFSFISMIAGIGLLLVGPCSLFAQNEIPNEQMTIPRRDFLPFSLYSLMMQNAYMQALPLAHELQEMDSLRTIDCVNIVDCYIFNGLWEESLNTALHFSQIYPESSQKMNHGLALSYYALGEHDKAEDYFQKALQVENEYFPLETLSAYRAMNFSAWHKYVEADSCFSQYFEGIRKKYNVKMDQLKTLYKKDFIGIVLEKYALNSLFMGKESETLNLLKYAGECGNGRAVTIRTRLNYYTYFGEDNALSGQAKKGYEVIAKEYHNTYDINASADEFWEKAKLYSQSYQDYQKATKGKYPKNFELADAYIRGNKEGMQLILKSLNPYQPGNIESTLYRNLHQNVDTLKEIRIYDDKEVNAFATPYGEVYLTSGMMRAMQHNISLLTGICAHEMAHFVCKHKVVENWKQRNKARNNKIMSNVLAGLNAALYTTGSVLLSTNNRQMDGSAIESLSQLADISTTAIQNEFALNTFYYEFKYSREKELEADILAYRFCEAVGMGGYVYIAGLMLMGSDASIMAGKTDSHPTAMHRIEVLKALYHLEHPQ